MAKAVIVQLTGDIPDNLQGQNAVVTVGGKQYPGKISVIIVFTPGH
jgi:hypothetical protein